MSFITEAQYQSELTRLWALTAAQTLLIDELTSKLKQQCQQTTVQKSYVSEVPDHCERIVWRKNYYMLLPNSIKPTIEVKLPKQVTEGHHHWRGGQDSTIEKILRLNPDVLFGLE